MFDGPQLLCVAGTGAIIKVIDTCRRMLFATLSGHGDDIYDLRFSPIDEWILLSASKDESLRMWNVKNVDLRSNLLPAMKVIVTACLAWVGTLTDCSLRVEVWTPQSNCGMWERGQMFMQQSPEVISVKPKRWDERSRSERKIPSRVRANANFLNRQSPYELCRCRSVRGAHLILSKDTNNMVVLWKPITTKTSRGSNIKTQQRLPNEVIALREFEVSHCDVWFIRFATDYQCQMLAVGNLIGDIKVFDIASRPTKKHFANLTNQYCASAIRMVAFNRDAKYLVAVSDDASVWLWEAVLNTKKQR
jgi:polycomb protein EED